jgi:very-short-patch-repair endonuclease
MSGLEDKFIELCASLALPIPEREVRFAAMIAGGEGKGVRERLRRLHLKDWRFDFLWRASRVAVEIEGGTHSGGRHVTGTGYAEDCRKYNAAELAGFIVLRFTSEMLRGGTRSEAATVLDDARVLIEG